jgi:hypothetical protein
VDPPLRPGLTGDFECGGVLLCDGGDEDVSCLRMRDRVSCWDRRLSSVGETGLDAEAADADDDASKSPDGRRVDMAATELPAGGCRDDECDAYDAGCPPAGFGEIRTVGTRARSHEMVSTEASVVRTRLREASAMASGPPER